MPHEYCTAVLPVDPDPAKHDATDALLNEYGAEGWELVTASLIAALPSRITGERPQPRLYCVWKRVAIAALVLGGAQEGVALADLVLPPQPYEQPGYVPTQAECAYIEKMKAPAQVPAAKEERLHELEKQHAATVPHDTAHGY